MFNIAKCLSFLGVGVFGVVTILASSPGPDKPSAERREPRFSRFLVTPSEVCLAERNAIRVAFTVDRGTVRESGSGDYIELDDYTVLIEVAGNRLNFRHVLQNGLQGQFTFDLEDVLPNPPSQVNVAGLINKFANVPPFANYNEIVATENRTLSTFVSCPSRTRAGGGGPSR